MQKTYCDHCGGECRNYTMTLYGHVSHTTSQGERLATDEMKPVDLCKACADMMAATVSIRFVTADDDDRLAESWDAAREVPGDTLTVVPGSLKIGNVG